MVMDRLNEALTELDGALSTPRAPELWRNAHNLLKRTTADQMKVGRLIAERNLVGLRAMVQSGIGEQQRVPGLSRPAQPAVPVQSAVVSEAVAAAMSADQASSATAVLVAPSFDQLRNGLRAFKKKMRVSQLDSDSHLTNRALTGGSRGTISAITPPTEFPRQVWEQLATEGKLKRAGHGMYALPLE